MFHFHSYSANLFALDDNVINEARVQASQPEHTLAMTMATLGSHIYTMFSENRNKLLSNLPGGSFGDIFDKATNTMIYFNGCSVRKYILAKILCRSIVAI